MDKLPEKLKIKKNRTIWSENEMIAAMPLTIPMKTGKELVHRYNVYATNQKRIKILGGALKEADTYQLGDFANGLRYLARNLDNMNAVGVSIWATWLITKAKEIDAALEGK